MDRREFLRHLGAFILVRSGEHSLDPSAQIINNGPRNRGNFVALTFDACMTYTMQRWLQGGKVGSYFNRSVIDVLNETQTPATLFLSGLWIESYPKDTETLAINPIIELADHTYDHRNFERNTGYGVYTNSQEKRYALEKVQVVLKQITGKDSGLFRFPGGDYYPEDLEFVAQEGLKSIQWDVRSNDAFQKNPDIIIRNVLNEVRPGSIISCHMNGVNAPTTHLALPVIISVLKDRGFKFLTVSDLLALDNPPVVEPKPHFEQVETGGDIYITQ